MAQRPSSPSRASRRLTTSVLAAAAILVLHGPGAAALDSPPETAITAVLDYFGDPLPAGNITLPTTVIFVFAGSDDVGVSGFECSLDGAEFAACLSPARYDGLALGEHAFAVRAVDTAGQLDGTPALATVTIEAAPEITITAAVDGHGDPVVNGGTTRSHRIMFSFTATDNGGIAGFECSLDWAPFAPCTSPVTYERLRRGPHTFRVQAIDDRGIRSLVPIFVWGVR
jgi:hypothetical protein